MKTQTLILDLQQGNSGVISLFKKEVQALIHKHDVKIEVIETNLKNHINVN